MQIKNKILNDLAKTATGAVGGLQSVKDEVDVIIKAHLEKHLSDMDIISREEFNVVKEMATKARLENEELKKQIAELKKQVK
ncbi:MAG: accessory factor UbiK family protein [Alphaproteobacteria bacterium]